MRIAATADLHYTPQYFASIRERLDRVRDEADVLVIAGDLTNYGKVSEVEPLLNDLSKLRIPTIAVLGNHDYESGCEEQLANAISAAGIKVLDGTVYERDGVAFAGAKGFAGGFGRAALTPFGEAHIKSFVQAALDEAMKLERAMSQLRSNKRVVVLHYAPIAETVQGENPEIFPYLGSSRLADVIDRHGADLVVHGHAHHGKPEGRTTAQIPVYNVAMSLMLAQPEQKPYRIFDV